jgi:hypothetical protein
VGDAADYTYISFDDDVRRAGAQVDPVGFIADAPEKVVLDEVQRVHWLCECAIGAEAFYWKN